MFLLKFLSASTAVFAQSGDGQPEYQYEYEYSNNRVMANDVGMGAALATEYNYYSNNYEYDNSNYEYDGNYELDVYQTEGFGNETDVPEGLGTEMAGPEEKKNKNKQKGSKGKDASAYATDSSAYASSGGATATGGASTSYGSSGTGSTGSTGYGSSGTTPLTCWKCHADSFELCEQTGYEQTCQPNEDSCELEIRERNGFILQIFTGCKAKDACKNNMANNFQGTVEAYTQCRPEGPSMGYTHSVCRQCCTEPNCVKSPTWWYPKSREEWAYTGEETAAGY